MGSFDFTTNKISKWKSTGIFNRSSNSKYFASSNMDAVGDASENLPHLKNDGRMNVYLSGNHFQQNVASIPNNGNVINIYCVYKLDSLASTRDTSFTIQDALCFDELCKLLKMLLIVQKLIIKDMVYVLMKEVNLVIQ